jgi:hypothetical protein
VAIYRILERTTAFQPEEVQQLTTAYEDVLRRLKLKDRSDPITELVAQRIIVLAQAGVKEAHMLSGMTIEQLGLKE